MKDVSVTMCISNRRGETKCFEEPVFRARGDGGIFSNHMIKREGEIITAALRT
jgi:hypothetical protein